MFPFRVTLNGRVFSRNNILGLQEPCLIGSVVEVVVSFDELSSANITQMQR